jgi:carotenoid cleavage dioxygenase-like enzyme
MDHAYHHVSEPSHEYDLDLDITAGTWPAALYGYVFIVGPWQPTLASYIYFGTGVLTRVDLAPNAQGRPHWRSKLLSSPDTDIINGLAETVDRETLFATMGSGGWGLANTAPHSFRDRLLMTFDEMRPAEFDPVTLAFKSYCGAASEYPLVKPHPLFPQVCTTGHPVEDIDEDCLWLCNLSMKPWGNSTTQAEGDLHVVRWDGSGDVQSWSVPGARVMHGIHEVTVTKDYVVFTEVGFQKEPGAIAGRGRTKPHLPYSEIYIVAKRDLTKENLGQAVPHARARVPYESFHDFADYAQDGDDITLYIAHSNGFDINYAIDETDTVWRTGETPASGLYGFRSAPVDASPVGRYVINGRTGEIKDSKLFLHPAKHWGAHLFARDMRRPAAERARYLWIAYWGCDPDMLITKTVEMYRDHPWRIVPVEDLPQKEVASTLVCIDLQTMTEHSSWSFPEGTFGQSPVFVPDETGKSDGWIIAFHQHRDHTELQVFDALKLDRGPIATATAPGLKQSYQIHSSFMPTIRSQDTGYRRTLHDDISDDWRSLPEAAHTVIEQVLARFA